MTDQEQALQARINKVKERIGYRKDHINILVDDVARLSAELAQLENEK